MQDISKFIAGFKRFQEKYFGADRALFEELKHAQRPKALVIACSDSRVDPAILTGSEPGELFVVRNVANLVPPYEHEGHYPGSRAALEYAVRHLQVEHIIVLGHARCGGIQALLDGAEDGEFIPRWVGIAERARAQVHAELAHEPPAAQARACEQAAILVSLENLLTFPWIRERVELGRLVLHGWYFDLEKGVLLGYDAEHKRFEPLSGTPPVAAPGAEARR